MTLDCEPSMRMPPLLAIFRLVVTLTFDLLTLKCMQFIFVPKCIECCKFDQISQVISEISCVHKLTDKWTHAEKFQKNASATHGARRQKV